MLDTVFPHSHPADTSRGYYRLSLRDKESCSVEESGTGWQGRDGSVKPSTKSQAAPRKPLVCWMSCCSSSTLAAASAQVLSVATARRYMTKARVYHWPLM